VTDLMRVFLLCIPHLSLPIFQEVDVRSPAKWAKTFRNSPERRCGSHIHVGK